jgi:hypothetical protein
MFPACANAKPKTLGMRGTAWGLSSSEGKEAYIRGVLDGLLQAGSKLTDEPVPDVSVDDLVKAVDRFYAVAENRKIPALFALEIIFMEANGKTKELRAKALARLRATFADR